ncbi:MAG TPA: enhanced serine sensitivity protein SseB C-terminal domain-containing protein [Thermoanaerobaculia bacterium]|nr:enhanced serine sensitivity protein SseB C-terminal domain-containing protein [Thermoanaerobaculia bacterium]
MNALETALMAAAKDPAARPDFYRTLVASDVVVVNASDEPHQLGVQPIEVNGAPAIAIFSSLERLRAVITSQVNYLQLNALELMKITRGARLVLDPGSDYGKELLPDEIGRIIDGTILQSQSYVAPRDTRILIGQPSRYPQELADVLARLFRNREAVRAAYLAHFFNPAANEKAHTLVAIDAGDDYHRIVGEAGLAAQGVTLPDPPVEFVRYGTGGGLDGYFRGVTPFYKR